MEGHYNFSNNLREKKINGEEMKSEANSNDFAKPSVG